ncbi:isochorismatase family protein [Pseudodesulfovibrio cashew]|uniref:Isochorismatase family protein n=1 Tax=Pseudodesulfovibrio cashew TaxID=2678688 RepID=A0A6I6JVN8_9BACT|nr:cysteine hydrolase family protein [Pseudodesulfovibrio cashew]QGY41774.1 isochorismatase family protein [Pseudodesulfovibrio cashew]
MADKTALVVVDVQNIMFETPDEVLFDGERVLETIGELIAAARQMKVPVVYIQHTTEGIGSPFEKDSHNWQVHPAIAPEPGDVTSLKYSYDAFFKTGLDTRLKGLGAERLVFCGLQTEVCVDTTVRSALAHGYKSVLIGDAHSSYDNGVIKAKDIVAHHNTVLDKRFCQVMPSKDFLF